MTKYVPFLKLKSNEIMALKVLDEELDNDLIPFFDYAKRNNITEKEFVATAERLLRSFTKNAGRFEELYLDNYDIDTDFEIGGDSNYKYLLSLFSDFLTIPVVSIDRSIKHINSVIWAKQSGVTKSGVVAFRVTPEDFQDFDLVSNDIESDLDEVFDCFQEIDLILDCRVCLNLNPSDLAANISSFIERFCEAYTVNRVVITGSSIPASIRDLTVVENDVVVPRVELTIFDLVKSNLGDDYQLTLGDYGIVSPNYSDLDIPAAAIRNVTAPKIIYSFDNMHFVIRGGALRTHPLGNAQYQNLSNEVVSSTFYRGEGYSFGDAYLAQKSRGEGSAATPSTMVKPLVNAHISYMCRDYPI